MKITNLTIPVLGSGEESLEGSIDFTLEDGDGNSNAYIVPQSAANFISLMEAVGEFEKGSLTQDELGDRLNAAMNPAKVATGKLKRLKGIMSDRLTSSDGEIHLDGDRLPAPMESYVMRLLAEDGTPKDQANWLAFGAFLEKLHANQSRFVREQFFGWLVHEALHGDGFTLTPEGDVIGYKGVRGTVDAPVSIYTGHAIVNDEPVSGHIPNPLGGLVEMARSSVMDDPAIGCAVGLHVGTYAYAKNWAQGVLLKVVFSPADVVSVPTDCGAQKVRVCRYRVLEVIQAPVRTAVDYTASGVDKPKKFKGRRKLIKRALKAELEVKFSYNGRKRTVEPVKLYRDYRGWKLDGHENGQYKTFFLESMGSLRVKSPKK